MSSLVGPDAAAAQDLAALLEVDAELSGEVFAPGVISSPDSSESSPSVTADGRTMVFTRYANYGEQVPYMATHASGEWRVERLSFAEVVYNLAISPDGEMIVYATPRARDGDDEAPRRVYRVLRRADGSWGEPVEHPELRSTNAGYFDLESDGSLYLYARPGATGDDPTWPRGIYRTELRADGGYRPIAFVGRAVSPEGSNTFDVEVVDDGRQLLTTRGGIPPDEVAPWGRRGVWLHRRTDDGWDDGRRLPLPYAWGATVLPDGRLLFVDQGDLRVVDLPANPVDAESVAAGSRSGQPRRLR